MNKKKILEEYVPSNIRKEAIEILRKYELKKKPSKIHLGILLVGLLVFFGINVYFIFTLDAWQVWICNSFLFHGILIGWSLK